MGGFGRIVVLVGIFWENGICVSVEPSGMLRGDGGNGILWKKVGFCE